MSKTRMQNANPLVRKAISGMLAISLAVMPWNAGVTQAFASELNETANEEVVETVANDAVATLNAIEEEAQNISTTGDEIATETENLAAEPAQVEEKAAPELAKEAELTAAPVEEKVVEAAPAEKPAAPAVTKVPVKVTITYMDTDGSMKTKSLRSTTLKTNGSTTISASSYTTCAKNRSIDGVSYEFLGWQDADGQIASIPQTITFDMAVAAMAEDGTAYFNYTASYAEHQPITVTIIAQGMVDTSGPIADKTISTQTLSWGSGTGISLKKLESATGIKAGNSSKADFTYGGYRYHYTSNWVGIDATSSAIDLSKTVMLYNKAGEDSATALYFSEDTTLVLVPDYEKTMIGGLDYFCIDNVSTGSSSWSNADEQGQRSDFSSFTYTFKNPEVASPKYAQHYSFVQWVDFDNDKTYQAGDEFTYTVGKDGAADSVSTYRIYAQWQPSVTVNYYNWNGELLKSVEQFSDIDTESAYEAPEIKGAEFLGWYAAADEKAEKADAIYAAPEATTEPVARTEYNVYAHYNTSYEVKHSVQSLDDENVFELVDSSTVKQVFIGTAVEAIANLYEGFTFDATLADTLTSGTVAPGLVLQLLYARDAYTVTYVYEGTVPADAPELPAPTTYKYGAAVAIADEPTLAGYTFSGWDRVDFTMPAEDIVITGSFTAIPVPVAAAGSTQDAAPAGNGNASVASTVEAPAMAAAAAANPTAQIESINDDAAPLANGMGIWSLFDLVASIATVLLSAATLLGLIGRKRLARILSIAPAAGAAILFILTQNLAHQMVIFDSWSIVFAIIALAAIALAVASRKAEEDDEDENADAWMGMELASATA